MKAIIALFILFSLTLGLQQVQAQSGKSYQEWLEENRAGGKKTTAKAPAKSKAKPTKAEATAAAEPALEAAPVLASPSGTFRGTLACKDCQGIKTELTLNGDSKGSFTMKQIYMGKPADKSVVNSSGKWFLAKGNKQNPDAVVLQLIPTAGDIDPMYFLQVSDTEVKLLTKTQDEIGSSKNHSLRKL
ncbi:copper resistance protein NlpE N-terminal domain-containing protein [Pontibacter sp. HSC-36F09]|uniref:copper resistance protein NlpE N-terminal domain-containing protein n=1 Tax=Pontibacter sp. HSC-36F09 TaxID=2910966 RepID=UPI0020A15044|nr:copper resistance protein NlpE N-terminal domain-containing protein [Pontibacter sp. HSC-36F09]MCP2043920.1 putative lipoprotein NlpE involved in copper resistance [Pontibacter sp. HSC-36F09]